MLVPPCKVEQSVGLGLQQLTETGITAETIEVRRIGDRLARISRRRRFIQPGDGLVGLAEMVVDQCGGRAFPDWKEQGRVLCQGHRMRHLFHQSWPERWPA